MEGRSPLRIAFVHPDLGIGKVILWNFVIHLERRPNYWYRRCRAASRGCGQDPAATGSQCYHLYLSSLTKALL